MTRRTRLIARIALFAALIYVLSWGTTFLPNVNLAFFVAFVAGYLWGALPGMTVGAVGMWLWTSFNPYGPAALPVAVAQVAGLALSGLIGAVLARRPRLDFSRTAGWLTLVLAALSCTLAFYIPVALVDAWLFQPFYPRLIAGLPMILISMLANMFIFPLLFRIALKLNEKERVLQL